MLFTPLFSLFLPFHPLSRAWAQATLAPIEVTGSSSTEVLSFDPIVAPKEANPRGASANGNIGRELGDQIALPLTDYAQPGTVSQFRGAGRTVEDTNVQTLGVPLNFPQGGGFDLSTFPQYIWSRAQFQLGPHQGAYDARSSAGTLTLVPWTDSALRESRGDTFFRGSEFFSRGISQTAIGAKVPGHALLVGYSAGAVQGFSGSYSHSSTGLFGRENFRLGAHLLASSLTAQIPGSVSFPSPGATQATTRIIPVVQGEWIQSPRAALRLTLFGDASVIINASSSFSSLSRPTQIGAEAVETWSGWRAAISHRQVFFSSDYFNSPGEALFHASFGRQIYLSDRLTLDPMLQGDLVTGQPFYAGVGLGARYELNPTEAFFARVSATPRFATLTDRYNNYPSLFGGRGFQGNAALAPEKNLTLNFGYEKKLSQILFSRTQVFFQRKDDLQILSPLPGDSTGLLDTMLNAGAGQNLILQEDFDTSVSDQVNLYTNLTYSDSKILNTGARFPYLPVFSAIAGVRVHDPDQKKWASRFWARANTETTANVSGTTTLPSTIVWNTDITLTAPPTFQFVFRIENLLDRNFELIQGYPLLGRTLSLMVTAQL